jgi:hypothetical protein
MVGPVAKHSTQEVVYGLCGKTRILLRNVKQGHEALSADEIGREEGSYPQRYTFFPFFGLTL